MRIRETLLVFCCLIACAFTHCAAQAQDMPLSDVLMEGHDWELVAEGFEFTEGPAVDGRGNLFFTDVRGNRIYRLDAEGTLRVFVENSDATNGLMFGPDGRLYGCQNGKKRIVAFDAKGNATTIAEGVACNDLVVTRDGHIYFTDPENKRVWHVAPDGAKRVVDTGIERPNGVILWRDQGTLVVADTWGPHLWAFRIEAEGSLAYKQPFYTMRMVAGRRGSGADGMTVDAQGRLYVATYAGLQVFDTTGRLSGVILKPQDRFLSNVTFGGPELHWLYVTCSDKVYRRKTKARGTLYFQDVTQPGKTSKGNTQAENAREKGTAISNSTVRVLVVTGPQHPAHDWRATTPALEEVLSRDSVLAVMVVEDPAFLGKKELADYDVLVTNYGDWQGRELSDSSRSRFADYVRSGGGLVLLHYSNGAFREWPEYSQLCRRRWVDGKSGHDPFGSFRVEITAKDHPLTRGMEDFETVDELYYRQQGEAPITVLAEARSSVTGEREPMAFVYRYGEGRVFQTVLGHSPQSIRAPGTAELLRRGCRWVAGRMRE